MESSNYLNQIFGVVHPVMEQTGIQAGDVLVIIGRRTLGLLSSQVSKIEGGFVVVLGFSVNEGKPSLARKLGADIVINIDRENSEDVIKDLTKGDGADVVLECSGSSAGVKLALKMAKK